MRTFFRRLVLGPPVRGHLDPLLTPAGVCVRLCARVCCPTFVMALFCTRTLPYPPLRMDGD